MERFDILKLKSLQPHLWYSVFFFETFQWATMFNPMLDALRVGLKIAAAALR